MPAAASPYRAPWWLPGGHAQTIAPATVLPAPAVDYRRIRWDTPDGDFIDLDQALPAPADAAAPVLALFHGLEGSSQSHYARAIARHFADAGERVVVVHFRGCSGTPNRQPRAYHSGDSDEADWILRRLHAQWPRAPLRAVGVSLGGNVLAKWLGERGQDAGFVRAAASIGSPLDLAAGGAALARGANRLYTRMFLASLIPKTLAQLRRHPGLADPVAVRAARDLRAYDNAYTAPVHGFRDADDYWARASGKPWLAHVRVPHLVLNAYNDPFVPPASLPRAAEVSAQVVLEQPAEGGHVGFALGWRGRSYLPVRLAQFFAAAG